MTLTVTNLWVCSISFLKAFWVQQPDLEEYTQIKNTRWGRNLNFILASWPITAVWGSNETGSVTVWIFNQLNSVTFDGMCT